MLFNTWEFLTLLVVTLLTYYAVPVSLLYRRAYQVAVLLLASGVFYGWNNPHLLLLLAVSCLGNTYATLRLLECRAKSSEKAGKRILQLAVAGNLALLAIFKYAGFLLSQLPAWLLPEAIVAAASDIPLPIGISFYTFQGISLLVDVWRREVPPEEAKRIFGGNGKFLSGARDLSFYIAFFPQLVAGPIVKAHEFLGQIGAKELGRVEWGTVFRCLITGYFLKMVVADNLAEQTVILNAPWMTVMSPLDLMALLYGYSFQIFADFAGYSLIAIGLGALFGYRLPENFRFPYLSTSVTEFWKRWHISLSSWLRDYLYIPLGGNRKGTGRVYFNLFLVMLLGGLWHGPAWKFAIWGSLHGVFLAAERLFFRRSGKLASSPSSPKWRNLKAVLGWFYTFHAVTFLWLTFLMPDLQQIMLFFRELTLWSGSHAPQIYVPVLFGGAIVLYHAAGWISEHRNQWTQRFRGSVAEGMIYAVMLFLIITNSGAPKGFIYFQF